MPLLDVSWVTQDPMLADVFSVTRRTDAVGSDGVTVPTPVQSFLAQVGVVTQQDPAELMRRDDEQHVPRRIFVASTFAFRGASASPDGLTQYQPDEIRWPVDPLGADLPETTVYRVVQVYPYSRYGRGMHECVAESQRAVDVPQ